MPGLGNPDTRHAAGSYRLLGWLCPRALLSVARGGVLLGLLRALGRNASTRPRPT
jgi:hypothetical protein